MVGEDCLDVLFNGEKADGVQLLDRGVALDITLMAGEGVVEKQVGIRLHEFILWNEHRWSIDQNDGSVESPGQKLLAFESIAQMGGGGDTVFHLNLQRRGGALAWFGGYEDESASTDADYKHTFCRGADEGMLHVAFFSIVHICGLSSHAFVFEVVEKYTAKVRLCERKAKYYLN